MKMQTITLLKQNITRENEELAAITSLLSDAESVLLCLIY